MIELRRHLRRHVLLQFPANFGIFSAKLPQPWAQRPPRQSIPAGRTRSDPVSGGFKPFHPCPFHSRLFHSVSHGFRFTRSHGCPWPRLPVPCQQPPRMPLPSGRAERRRRTRPHVQMNPSDKIAQGIEFKNLVPAIESSRTHKPSRRPDQPSQADRRSTTRTNPLK